MLQIYLPVILTIVILASVGFAASASAHKTIKSAHKTIKVDCHDLKRKLEFSIAAIKALAIVDNQELDDLEDDIEIGRQTVSENFDKILKVVEKKCPREF